MVRLFDRNMFIMLLAIMIGVIIITFFVADIVNRSTLDELQNVHEVEIKDIQSKNENFTSSFIKSTVILDQAREDRAFGSYHFDLAFLWYQSALVEKNSSNFELYKIRGIDNCTNAMPKYQNAHDNFDQAKTYFNDTKSYTTFSKYLEVLDIYVDLTGSGSRLMLLRYNASNYLKILTENLILDVENNTVVYMENVTDILELFNETLILIEEETEIYEEHKEEIDEYEFFDEIR